MYIYIYTHWVLANIWNQHAGAAPRVAMAMRGRY